jgi:peptidyl-prolyl cis-trans isomerase A (cyclophilin A)
MMHRTMNNLAILMTVLMAMGAAGGAGAASATERQATTPGGGHNQPQTRPAEMQPANAGMVYVQMTTSKGDIYLELNHDKAPITVDNFLKYVDQKFYDGTIFHRVISSFMIQGGGHTPDMAEKPTGPPIKNEWKNGLKNTRGTIAMARTASADSATAQFFINVVDNPRLDEPISGGAGYAVFGKVVAGMKTVDEIKGVPTKPGDVPQTPVIIQTVKRITAEDAKKAIDAEAKAPQGPKPDAK